MHPKERFTSVKYLIRHSKTVFSFTKMQYFPVGCNAKCVLCCIKVSEKLKIIFIHWNPIYFQQMYFIF